MQREGETGVPIFLSLIFLLVYSEMLAHWAYSIHPFRYSV